MNENVIFSEAKKKSQKNTDTYKVSYLPSFPISPFEQQ